MNTRHGFLAGVLALGLGGWVIGADTPTIHHSNSTPSHSTHTTSTHDRPSVHERHEMERRERAWRDWYYRYHHRYIRPGYGYPSDYPPGYTESEPTPGTTTTTGTPQTGTYSPGQNAGNTGTPQTTTVGTPSLGSPSAASGGTPVSSTADAPSAPAPVDPELLSDLNRVKKACTSRPDYVAAVADKTDAEEKLAELRKNDTGTFETTAPLATRAMNAKKLIAAIEREETARAAKLLESQPQTPPPTPTVSQ